MDMTKELLRFRDLLSSSWPNVQRFLIPNTPDEFVPDWMQANCEMSTETCLCNSLALVIG